MEPVNFDQVIKRFSRRVKSGSDFLLGDKVNVLPGEPSLGYYNTWIPRIIDPEQVELTPCSFWGDRGPDTDYVTKNPLIIGRQESHFSIIVFPEFRDSLEKRVSLEEVRNGSKYSSYTGKAYVISRSGAIINHK